MEKEVFIKWPQRSWVLLGICLSFRRRTQNVLRPSGHLFYTLYKPSSPLFSAKYSTQKCRLLCSTRYSPLIAATSSVLVSVTAASTQGVASYSSSHSACVRSLPTKHQSEASGCQTLLRKWSKSHFGSSWLLEQYTQCLVSGSTCGGVLALEGYFDVSTDRNSCVLSEAWSSRTQSSEWHACIGPQAKIENILTEILFLRSKSWLLSAFYHPFLGDFLVLIKTKPNPHCSKALQDTPLLICHI